MRLLLFLAAAAVMILGGPPPRKVTKLELPGKFEKGTLITFWFKHKSWSMHNDDPRAYDQPVRIIFTDKETLDDPYNEQQEKQCAAHLYIGLRNTDPVVSYYTMWDSSWDGRNHQLYDTIGEDIDIPLDVKPPVADGWWRVDVYKHHDKEHMSVFLQGFSGKPRKFKGTRKLDDVKSVYLTSDFIDHDTAKIILKKQEGFVTPPGFLDMPKWAKKWDSYIIQELKGWPVNETIEMVTVLKASGNDYRRKPALMFNEPYSSPFLRIFQVYGPDNDNNQQLWLSQAETLDDYKNTGYLCTDGGNMDKPHGDMQHLSITRTGENELTIQIYFKARHELTNMVKTCTFKHNDLSPLNRKFEIILEDTASLLLFKAT